MADNGAKVEQFLLLAKSARGLALADLVAKATAEPGLFTFGELLALPGVQEVRRGGVRRRGLAGAGTGTPTAAAHHQPPPPPPPTAARPAARPARPPVQLAQGEHAGAHRLLELFAYGSWDDYKGAWLQ